MLKVVDHALSIEKIHGCRQEIPIQRLCEPQVLLLIGDIGDSDDLLERYDLDSRDKGNDIDMTREQCNEETSNHNKSPYRPSDEGLLLLLIFRLRGLLKVRIVSDMGLEIMFRLPFETDLFDDCRWFGSVTIFARAHGL